MSGGEPSSIQRHFVCAAVNRSGPGCGADDAEKHRAGEDRRSFSVTERIKPSVYGQTRAESPTFGSPSLLKEQKHLSGGKLHENNLAQAPHPGHDPVGKAPLAGLRRGGAPGQSVLRRARRAHFVRGAGGSDLPGAGRRGKCLVPDPHDPVQPPLWGDLLPLPVTLDGQGQIRFFGAETAPSFVFLIAGRQPACFVSLPGHDFRSRKTPADFPASKNQGWRGRGRRWAGAHRGR